jgi:hypothetical protein
MQESPDPSIADLTPLQLHSKITELFKQWESVLREAGISVERYQVPQLASYHTIRRLKSVLAELMSFVRAESCQLFLCARRLHPEGVLARWAADKNMRSARDVQIYIDTRSLFRQAWYNNVALKSFFKVKVLVTKE